MLENLKLGPAYEGFLFLAEAARNPPLLSPHHHVELELNLVKRGTITYVVGGRRFSFPARTLLWMFPAQEHQLVDRTADAEYYVAVFKPGLITRSCRSPRYEGLKCDRIEGEGVLHTALEPEDFDAIGKAMHAMLEESIDPDVLNREAGFGAGSGFRFEHGDPDGLNAGLHHLLLWCWRCQVAGRRTRQAVTLHPAVLRALVSLRAQESGEKLARLAARSGVSSAYLSRIFARQIGVPLSRYRNSVRLARFWELYRLPPQKTLMEAAYAAGFGSYAQFYKVFFEAYGRGPRELLRAP